MLLAKLCMKCYTKIKAQMLALVHAWTELKEFHVQVVDLNSTVEMKQWGIGTSVQSSNPVC